MKRILLIKSALVLALVLVATGCAPKAAPPQETENLEFYATSPTMATPYQVSLAISEMLKAEHPWLRAAPLPGEGPAAVETSDGLPPERRKNAFVVGFTTPAMGLAWSGNPPYQKKYTNLKLVATVSVANGWTFVTYDPTIKNPQDMIGKKVGVHPPAHDPYRLGYALLKDAWGIVDKVELSYHMSRDWKDLLVTGLLDVCFGGAVSRAPAGKWTSIGETPPIVLARDTYFMSVTEEDVRKINDANPWKTWLVKMPKDGAMENIPTADTNMLGWRTNMACWDTADEEVIYELVKFLDENSADYERRMRLPGGAEAMALLGPGVTEADVHPGALRYYKEKGVKVGG